MDEDIAARVGERIDVEGSTYQSQENLVAHSSLIPLDSIQLGKEPQRTSNDLHDVTKRLSQELAISSIHLKEIETHWRQILRKEKYKELHDEISPLSDYHEKNVEGKKKIIESILREFDCLKELYRKSIVANIVQMDTLITMYDDQTKLLERDFRTRVESLKNEFLNDVAGITAQFDSEKQTVRMCIRVQQEKNQYMEELRRQDTQHELEEIKNRKHEKINSLHYNLDSMVEQIEEQIQHANVDYAQSTDLRKSTDEQLKAKDMQMQKELRRKTRLADHLQNEIQRFQLTAKQEEAQFRERHQTLLERKSRALQKFHMTKDEMTKFRNEQQQKLIILSRRAHEKKEVLHQMCSLAERVKKIAQYCRKWETPREIFASVLRNQVDSDGRNNNKPLLLSCNRDTLTSSQTGERYRDESHLNHLYQHSIFLSNDTHRFWDKYNGARLDVLALEKQLDLLKLKEQELRKQIRRYNDCTTVNDAVLKDRNPLLVINGKMNIINSTDASKKTRRLTVMDANHIVSTHKMMPR